MTFRILDTADIDAKHADCLASQKTDILAGKLRIRWSQARCGYEIRSGRNAVLGTPTFVCESDAWAWLDETHGITK